MPQGQDQNFGSLLRRYRLERGWSQAKLAEHANVSVEAVSTLERGRRRAPYSDTLTRLADALGLSNGERISFTAAARPIEQDRTVPLPALSPRTNLPDEPTRFIGRERETEQIVGLLRDPYVRLVTLTGAAGSGKTRLALHVAAALLPDFPDGVFAVHLASIADPTRVPSAIAEALSVGERAGEDMMESLSAALNEKRLLLVLDNYEHVLSAGSVAATLLDRCRALHILITSRVPLHLGREHVYEVPPLSVPTPAAVSTAQDIAAYESVALFSDRARAAMSDFQVTDENAGAVAEICVRLDGLPLALELAAARIKLFQPAALLQRLSSRLEVLTGGARDAPERQRTLRGTLDWSYSLLTPSQQTLFARLAVFAGGSTIEAAMAVCDPNAEMDFLPDLTSLVEHSLVRQIGTERPRLAMLETVREYSAEKLVERDEAEAVARRHVEYYAAFMERLDYDATHAPAFMREVREERDNLLTALAWSRDHGDSMVGLRLVGALRGWEGLVRISTRPWLAVFTPALSRSQPSVRAKVLLAEAAIVSVDYRSDFHVHRSSSDREHAVRLIREALVLFRQESDPWVRLRGLIACASTLTYTPLHTVEGAMEAVEQAFSESLTLARSIGSLWAEAAALRGLGQTAHSLKSDHELEVDLVRQSLIVERQAGNAVGISDSLWALGSISLEKGDRLHALDLWGASIAEQRKAGYCSTWRQFELAFEYLQLGEHQRVPEIFRHMLESGWFFDRDAEYRSWLVLLASSAAVAGQFQRAARIFASVSPAWGSDFRSGAARAARYAPAFESYRASIREELGEAAWAALWEEGQAMTLEEAISYAMQASGYAAPDSCRP